MIMNVLVDSIQNHIQILVSKHFNIDAEYAINGKKLLFNMKHEASILLCEMSNGTVNIYINGVQVLVDNKLITLIDRIANCNLKSEDVIQILDVAKQSLINSKK